MIRIMFGHKGKLRKLDGALQGHSGDWLEHIYHMNLYSIAADYLEQV